MQQRTGVLQPDEGPRRLIHLLQPGGRIAQAAQRAANAVVAAILALARPGLKLKWAVRLAIIAMTAAVLASSWATWISDGPSTGSAYQNLRFAHNLAYHGVYSGAEDPQGRPDPSNYREPLAPAVIAAAMILLEPVLGDTSSVEALNESPQIRTLKFVNSFWGAILAAAIFAAIVQLSGSYLLAGVGAVFANWPLKGEFDRLNAEVEGAALLALASLLIYLAVSRRSPLHFALAGLSMGALALTKAVFLYIAIGMFATALLWGSFLLLSRSESPARVVRCLLALPLGVLLIAAPWMIRNQVHFGHFQIAERGGFALNHRVTKGQMTWTEYRGSFYAWAPRYNDAFYERWAPRRFRREIGDLLGFTRADMRLGGQLERLNRGGGTEFAEDDREARRAGRPQDAVSYYAAGRAMRSLVTRQMAEEGHPFPRHAAGAELTQRALRTIVEDPLRHLVTTVPFLWRGAAYTFPILLAFAVVGLARRRLDMVAYALPALGAVLFYALFSHFIPRYALPMDAVAVACILVLAYVAARGLMALGPIGWQGAARRVGGAA